MEKLLSNEKALRIGFKELYSQRVSKSHQTWNKGLKGHLNSEKCKATWFKTEDLLKRGIGNIGKPQDDKRNWLVCSTETIENYKNSQKKIGQRHKREGYARYILKKAGIEIPKGCVVFHIDGDYTNNEIGNLKIITRAELAKLNKINLRRWKKDDRNA